MEDKASVVKQKLITAALNSNITSMIDIKDAMKKLGLTFDEEGVCHGLASIAIEAALEGEVSLTCTYKS